MARHCEERSNRELYKAALLIGDCFVPRNDVQLAELVLSLASCFRQFKRPRLNLI